MKKRIAIIISIVAASILPVTFAHAAPASSQAVGVDVSVPQCGDKILNRFAFIVVGVNSGLPTKPNPCLADQLAWAKTSTGTTTQPKLQLYVNTANPAGLNTESWPQDNIDPGNAFVLGEHGLCDGGDSLACAWQYGWNRAYEDVNYWLPPAAEKASVDTRANQYRWWLDVETENTWKTGRQTADYQSNIAVIEGMQTFFSSRGIKTGLYSTAYQWNEITGGQVSDTSNLNGLPNWRPGGRSLSTAKDACKAKPLTKDGSVELVQYIYRGLDYNHVCAN